MAFGSGGPEGIFGSVDAQNPGAGGTWPGFSLSAPPKVATASALGTATTAAHGDHTHGLDLVPYTPSLVPMQAAGLLQQTFSGGLATPALLTMTNQNIPFGNATNTLSQDGKFQYITGAIPHLVVSKDSAPPSATGINGMLSLIAESASTLLQLSSSRASTVAGSIIQTKSRGTWAAPTAVLLGDTIGLRAAQPYDGTNYLSSMQEQIFVPTDGNVSTGNVTLIWGLQVLGGGSVGTLGDMTRTPLAVDTDRNVYGGWGAIAANSTNGFFYMPDFNGTPTGVPAQTFGSTRAATRTPMGFDHANGRLWAYYGGAWHFTAFT